MVGIIAFAALRLQLISFQRSFTAVGSLTLGGSHSIGLGPLDRNGEAHESINTSGKPAPMLDLFVFRP